jgi:hypothetical protein
MRRYNAPWDRLLTGASIGFIAVLAGVAVVLALTLAPWLAILPLAILLASALFAVRGFRIESGSVVVERLLWSSTLPLQGLRAARADRDAFRQSARTFGNGGAFAFTGWYAHPALGEFRAFVTDRDRAVVLEWPHEKVVLSPDAPDEFVREISAFVVPS